MGPIIREARRLVNGICHGATGACTATSDFAHAATRIPGKYVIAT